jgi:hypothetical protein
MVLVAALLALLAPRFSARERPIGFLISRSLLYGVAGAGISLAFTIAWMIWYEWSTGYSAGNGPLGWIFFYGPTSIALGQIAALLHWWFKKAQGHVGT